MKLLFSLACAGLTVAAALPASAADLLGTSPPLTMPAKPRPDRVRAWHELVRARRSRRQLRQGAKRLILEHRAAAARRRRRAVHNRRRNTLVDHELHRRRRLRLSVERLVAVRRDLGLPHRPGGHAPGDGGLSLRPHRSKQPNRLAPWLSLQHDQHLQRLCKRDSSTTTLSSATPISTSGPTAALRLMSAAVSGST